MKTCNQQELDDFLDTSLTMLMLNNPLYNLNKSKAYITDYYCMDSKVGFYICFFYHKEFNVIRVSEIQIKKDEKDEDFIKWIEQKYPDAQIIERKETYKMNLSACFRNFDKFVEFFGKCIHWG